MTHLQLEAQLKLAVMRCLQLWWTRRRSSQGVTSLRRRRPSRIAPSVHSSTNHYGFAVEPEGLCYLEAPMRVESLNTKAKRGGKQKAPRRDGEGMQEGGRMKVVSSQPFVLSRLSDAKS